MRYETNSAPNAQTETTAGLKKVSFGGISKKKADTKTVYPTLPDPDGENARIAQRIVERTEQFEALKGALETDKSELRLRATLPYFQINHGKHEVPSSLSVASPAGEVLVTFQNRYSGLESDSAILPILGEQTSKFFRQRFELKIDGDKLPQLHAQELLDELQALFTKYNAMDALEVKDSIKPDSEFHSARHLILTPKDNFRLNQVCPIVAMIKTKGRK